MISLAPAYFGMFTGWHQRYHRRMHRRRLSAVTEKIFFVDKWFRCSTAQRIKVHESIHGFTCHGFLKSKNTFQKINTIGLLYTMPIFINFFAFSCFFTVLTFFVKWCENPKMCAKNRQCVTGLRQHTHFHYFLQKKWKTILSF